MKVLEQLKDSDRVVDYLGHEEDDDHHFLFFKCYGSDLRQYVARERLRIREDLSFVLEVFLECLCGLTYLHELDIVHRDIKPENILVDEEHRPIRFKLTDFNCSRELEGRMSAMVGTEGYMAPELSLFSEQELRPSHYEKVDLWSLGIMVSEMYLLCSVSDQLYSPLHIYTPFRLNLTKDQPSLRHFYAHDIKEDIMLPKTIPPFMRQLLRRMLQVSPEDRISFHQLYAAILHHLDEIRQLLNDESKFEPLAARLKECHSIEKERSTAAEHAIEKKAKVQKLYDSVMQPLMRNISLEESVDSETLLFMHSLGKHIIDSNSLQGEGVREVEDVVGMCSLLLLQVGVDAEEVEEAEVMEDFVEGRLRFLEKRILRRVGVEELKPVVRECYLL